jgi:DNA replication protein DnaC
MLIHPTLDALIRLKLHGIAQGLEHQMTDPAVQQLSFEERLALLVEREVAHRDNRRLGRLWKACQPKERAAALEDIDYRARSGLDRAQLAGLATNDYIHNALNILIDGTTGSGKTYLACALGQNACRSGLSAWYVRAPRLFEDLSLCHADGTFRKRLAAIARVQLLIVDDFAISPLGPRERNDLLELLDDRVGSRSTIICSQLPPASWHEYLNDPTVADAIMDRLIHRSHKIHLQSKESMRSRTSSKGARVKE